MLRPHLKCRIKREIIMSLAWRDCYEDYTWAHSCKIFKDSCWFFFSILRILCSCWIRYIYIFFSVIWLYIYIFQWFDSKKVFHCPTLLLTGQALHSVFPCLFFSFLKWKSEQHSHCRSPAGSAPAAPGVGPGYLDLYPCQQWCLELLLPSQSIYV